MSHYSKLAQTPEQLVDKLIGRGLAVPDRARALAYIQHVGAYRLKGYWFHLLSPTTKIFPAGLTFDAIAERYEFDRRLRSLSFDAIERIEVAVRA